MKGDRNRRVLAVSSGGGHWVQMLRLRPAFEGHRVTYVTVRRSYAEDVPGQRFRTIVDATRWNRVKLVMLGAQLVFIMLRERPHVVISTGAAPGYFALRLGRLFGARTVWLDSIANIERMSMTGDLVRPWADAWLTQWRHLAGESGPSFEGAVL